MEHCVPQPFYAVLKLELQVVLFCFFLCCLLWIVPIFCSLSFLANEKWSHLVGHAYTFRSRKSPKVTPHDLNELLLVHFSRCLGLQLSWIRKVEKYSFTQVFLLIKSSLRFVRFISLWESFVSIAYVWNQFLQWTVKLWFSVKPERNSSLRLRSLLTLNG